LRFDNNAFKQALSFAEKYNGSLAELEIVAVAFFQTKENDADYFETT